MRSDTIPLRGRGADGHNLLVSDALGLPGVPLATGHCPIHNWPRSASHPIVAGVAAVPEGCSRAGHGRARRRLRPQRCHWTGRDAGGVRGFPRSSSRAAISVVAVPEGRCRSGHGRARGRLWPQCHHRTGGDAGGVRSFGKHREAQLAEASACGDGLRDPLWSHEVEAHCTTRGAIMQGGPLLRHAQPRADHVRGPALREAGRQLSTM
mmetsp:Transcript_22026/g.61385  ORF Transcript_22026/g.61385 Transcript_22026/m.61385 type:complete len:208 (+) Transcript_22026:171-794(+)